MSLLALRLCLTSPLPLRVGCPFSLPRDRTGRNPSFWRPVPVSLAQPAFPWCTLVCSTLALLRVARFVLGREGEASSPPGGRGAVPRPPACPSWLHRWSACAGRRGDSSGECSWAGMGLPYHHHLGRFQKGGRLNRGCPPLPRKALVPAPGAVPLWDHRGAPDPESRPWRICAPHSPSGRAGTEGALA